MKLKCKRCKREWDYRGKKKPDKSYNQYTSCPICKSLVKISKENKRK